MDDEAGVRLVDPHPERRGGDDDVELVVHPRPLGVLALGPAQAGVVRPHPQAAVGELLGDLLGALAGGAVDDARSAALADLGEHPVEHALLLAVGVGVVVDLEADLRAVEPGDDHLGVAHLQPLHDLGADRGCGGGREGQHRRVAELLDDPAQPQVVGAEVVAPRRDAVRLVHHEQGRPCRVDRVHDLGLGELLRREEHEADRSVRQCLQDGVLVAGRHARVQLGGPTRAVLDLGQPLDLVALQGDQRGDHDDRPVEQLARDLVDRRLPRAGRQDREGVPAGDDRLHRLLLAGPELRESEDVARELADATRPDGGGVTGTVVGGGSRGHPLHLPGGRDRQTVPLDTRTIPRKRRSAIHGALWPRRRGVGRGLGCP